MCVMAAMLLAAMAAEPAAAQTPIWATDDQVIPQDAQWADRFGHVRIRGNVAIVGAPFHNSAQFLNSGAAYIYARDGNDWVKVQKIEALDPEEDARFGMSVDIDGGFAVVAAPGYFDGTGAVYVFRRNPSNPPGEQWEQATILFASDGEPEDHFGGSFWGGFQGVAMDWPYVVVGAPGRFFVVGTTTPGKAYVFHNSGNPQSWTEEAILTAGQHAHPKAGFGRSVGISAGRIVVGAPREKDAGVTTGAAYVFGGSPGWSLEERFAGAGGHFGWSVDIDSGQLIVGAPSARRAYVYRRGTHLPWTLTGELSGSNPPFCVSSSFGSSVGISGSIVVVGAPWHGYPADPCTRPGAAYVYQWQLNDGDLAWVEVAQIVQDPELAHHFDLFGHAAAVSGGTVAVGAIVDAAATACPPGPGAPCPGTGVAYFFPAIPDSSQPPPPTGEPLCAGLACGVCPGSITVTAYAQCADCPECAHLNPDPCQIELPFLDCTGSFARWGQGTIVVRLDMDTGEWDFDPADFDCPCPEGCLCPFCEECWCDDEGVHETHTCSGYLKEECRPAASQMGGPCVCLPLLEITCEGCSTCVQ